MSGVQHPCPKRPPPRNSTHGARVAVWVLPLEYNPLKRVLANSWTGPLHAQLGFNAQLQRKRRESAVSCDNLLLSTTARARGNDEGLHTAHPEAAIPDWARPHRIPAEPGGDCPRLGVNRSTVSRELKALRQWPVGRLSGRPGATESRAAASAESPTAHLAGPGTPGGSAASAILEPATDQPVAAQGEACRASVTSGSTNGF